MEQYKVEITKEALQELTLDTFPQRYRIMDSEPEKQMELRRMLVDNYSVFYTICADKVIVTDVLHDMNHLHPGYK